MFFSALFGAGVLFTATHSNAQPVSAPENPAQDAVAPAAAEDWHVVSRSSQTVYMVDVNGITRQGDVTSARLARVPTTGETGDLTHSVGQIEFRCQASQSRPGEETLYGADGSIEDRIDDGYDFDRITANTLDAYVQTIVCDGDRSVATYPSIRAFIEAGRPDS